MTNDYESWAQWLTRLLAVLQSILPNEWEPSYHPFLSNGDTFDYIVVGAGSAGAIVASRLAEDPCVTVLLVEAGGDPPLASVVPPLFPYLAKTEADWQYRAYYDEGTGLSHVDGIAPVPLGKCLGGSSSVNIEVYSRGVPEDYDWNSFAPGWTWKTVLPYFKKSEGMIDREIINNPAHSYLHSTDGPVLVSRPNINKYFIQKNEYLMNSFEEIGVKKVLESNMLKPYGITRPHSTFAYGRRSSTAEAFLKTDKVPPNLFVSKHTSAIKVLVDSVTKTAYGVEVMLQSEYKLQIYADKEVIVSAGAINTPKLLMLSGIGPAEELQKSNISVIHDLPVGKNLHDHVAVNLAIKGKSGKDNKLFDQVSVHEMDAYFFPLLIGYFNIDKSSTKPQFQVFTMHADANTPAVYRFCKALSIDDSSCQSVQAANQDRELDLIFLIMLHPKSKGQVKLKSNNFEDDPIIELGFFRDNDDDVQLAKAAKFLTALANTTYYREVNGEFAYLNITGCENKVAGTDDYWNCYVRNEASPFLHPTGTCAMTPEGVVDERFRVRGMKKLRVVDASVFPEAPSGNTNAPTMMLGEFAADLIKADN